MTTLSIHSKTDDAGNLRIEQMAIGVPNAEVDVVVTVRPKGTPEELGKLLEKASKSIDFTLFERLPQSPVRDPWEAK